MNKINERLIEKSKTKALTIFDVMHSFLHTMKYMHSFFNKTSPSYMQGYSKLHYWINYPKAYTGFMWLSFKDWKLNETPTEKDVLDKKFNNSKFPKDNQSIRQMKLYGSSASAVIHPPSHFNLPDMVITIFHIEKNSSFGEEDAMLIYLWLDVQKGYSYVPVAYVGDNPKAQDIWKAFMEGTPAGENVQLVKKEELQIQISGITLFAGWTREIPLLNSLYILKPSFLLIEGYGNLKTDSYTLYSPSNYKTEVKRNGFDAFVTFFHPTSKYSGPGTDGFFARDYTAITYPPQTI